MDLKVIECPSYILFQFRQMSGDQAATAATEPVWMTMVILLLLIALTFATTSVVLGIIVYRSRKDVKSWISSKVSKNQGMHSAQCTLSIQTLIDGFNIISTGITFFKISQIIFG